MDNLEQQIKISGAKKGLFLGVILTALSIISYYFIISITNSPITFIIAPIIFTVFIPIFCVVMICFSLRKQIGGYWTFKQATTGIFIVLLIAYLIQLVGKDLVFDRFVEPNINQKLQTIALNTKLQIMKKNHEKQPAIDKSMADLKAEFNNQNNITVTGAIQNIIFSIIFIFLMALIFGSLFKKDPPGYRLQN